MRSLAILAILAGTAHADLLNDTDKAFETEAGMTGAFAERVDVHLSIAGTKHCERLAGTVERAKVVACLQELADLHRPDVMGAIPKNELIAKFPGHLAIALHMKGSKIVAIGPVMPNAGDGKTPTTFGAELVTFQPSPQLLAQIEKRTIVITATHKICFSDTGKPTSRRLVDKSGIAAFDMESTAWVAALGARPPWQPFGKPQAVCDIVEVSFPSDLFPEDGPGGIEGGVPKDAEGVGKR